MQHYASCPVVARLAGAWLRLALAPLEERLEDLLLLNGRFDTSQLALRDLRLYATFMASNAARNGRASVASDAWVQAVTEAAARDSPLRRIVAALWSTSSLST